MDSVVVRSHAEGELGNVLIRVGDEPGTQIKRSDNQDSARSLGGDMQQQQTGYHKGIRSGWVRRGSGEKERNMRLLARMRARETTPRASSEQKPAQERGHRRDPERMR